MTSPINGSETSAEPPEVTSRQRLPSDVKRNERTRAAEREARELPDGELDERLSAAHREITELRARLEESSLRRDALEAEKDRRAIQRRAG